MKTIMSKDTGDDWNESLRKLASAEGIENPSGEDLRRLDREREGKKVSNEDRDGPTDPDSRIMRMMDGRTHLARKAEPAVELETDAIVAAQVNSADPGDPSTGPRTHEAADENAAANDTETTVTERVADKDTPTTRFRLKAR